METTVIGGRQPKKPNYIKKITKITFQNKKKWWKKGSESSTIAVREISHGSSALVRSATFLVRHRSGGDHACVADIHGGVDLLLKAMMAPICIQRRWFYLCLAKWSPDGGEKLCNIGRSLEIPSIKLKRCRRREWRILVAREREKERWLRGLQRTTARDQKKDNNKKNPSLILGVF